ncbi:Calcium uptake protein 1, mitochondrial [Allomyces arbusculus]|nr:Calcium uptake protein 1, mitochondrial [Allomyces arbusculus]
MAFRAFGSRVVSQLRHYGTTAGQAASATNNGGRSRREVFAAAGVTTVALVIAARVAVSPAGLLAEPAGEAPGSEVLVQGSSSLEHWKRRRIGHYENRIRAYSHPFKVFQYFASTSKGGTDYMTADDFIASLLPFRDVPDHERPDPVYRRLKTSSAAQFLKLADLDGDGLISFSEYMLFLTLLQIPDHHIDMAFSALDTDGNGQLSQSELLQFLHAESQPTRRPLFARLGRQEQAKITFASCHGLTRLLFGARGEQQLSRDAFRGFLQRLRYEVLKLEFFQYPVDESDRIGVKDMAYALVSYADWRKVEELQMRIARIPKSTERVSLDQFRTMDTLIKHLDEVELALHVIKSWSAAAATATDSSATAPSPALEVTKGELKKAIHAGTSLAVPDAHIDILFTLFDENGNGKIDFRTFSETLKPRIHKGLDTPRDFGFVRFLQQLRDCTRQHFFS